MPQQPDRPKRLRTAGSRWRILVHERKPGERMSGRAHDITSDPQAPRRHAETLRRLGDLRPDLPPSPDLTTVTVLEGTEFDELAVGRWIHLEQMDAGKWWMNVGGVTVNVTADRDGRPKVVDVYGPGDYDDAAEGCRYSLTWSAGDGGGSETAATG